MNSFFIDDDTAWEDLGEGVKKVLVKGDAYIAPKMTMHGAVALEEGSLLVDVFSLKRADFL